MARSTLIRDLCGEPNAAAWCGVVAVLCAMPIVAVAVALFDLNLSPLLTYILSPGYAIVMHMTFYSSRFLDSLDTEFGIIMAVDLAYWSTLLFVLFSMRSSFKKRATLRS